MKRLLLVALILAAGLTGCTQTTCASWVDFRTPAEMADSADLVIVGEETGTDGVTFSMGVSATAHTVRVDEVLKGELDVAEIRVVSLPDSCGATGDFYPEGDPIEVDGPAEFFLVRSDGNWTSLTPFESAAVIPAEGTLPWNPTPTPTPTP
ncbi:hypothetical protein EYE40_08165 [Glaciihabitans arcticus]|uniref:Lipoprotein n=1 Tax=Glaciihabitans arcticus TaxID=2668039 RepID=A0A4Q9GT87_9MICO|nr:hypothetical protein [Glaciihabitans arcticus]TBN57374.1 hypothetical protein EYE40_08165 [Glaciihabitans arcticus]